jgi:hypothetical protein
VDGISFKNTRRDGPDIELAEIIELLRPMLPAGLTWRLDIEDAASTSERGAAELLFDDVEMTLEMPLTQLLEATAEVQIIDGSVLGRQAGEQADTIVIEAVDSTFWNIYATDSRVLQELFATFPDAKKIPT